MSGVISSNLKTDDVSISNRFPEVHKRAAHVHTQTHTHTHTHDDSIRRNAMRCISPEKKQNDVFIYVVCSCNCVSTCIFFIIHSFIMSLLSSTFVSMYVFLPYNPSSSCLPSSHPFQCFVFLPFDCSSS